MATFVGRNGGFRVQMEVEGIDPNDTGPATIRRMKKLKDRKKAVNRIFRRALEPMRRDMSSLAPVDTGRLRDSFRIRSIAYKDPNVWAWRVGAVSGEGTSLGGSSFQLAGWRDHWAELGTRHHDPQPHIAPAISKNAGKVRSNISYEMFVFIDGLLNKG